MGQDHGPLGSSPCAVSAPQSRACTFVSADWPAAETPPPPCCGSALSQWPVNTRVVCFPGLTLTVVSFDYSPPRGLSAAPLDLKASPSPPANRHAKNQSLASPSERFGSASLFDPGIGHLFRPVPGVSTFTAAEEGAQSPPRGVGDLGQPPFERTANTVCGSER